MLNNVKVTNAAIAIKANGPQSFIIMTASTVTGNSVGVQVQNGATVYTSGNNTANGNSTNVTGSMTSVPLR